MSGVSLQKVIDLAAEVDRLQREVAAARADERAKVLAEVGKLEGLFSHHSDAKAAREHNVKTLHALIARLRGEVSRG